MADAATVASLKAVISADVSGLKRGLQETHASLAQTSANIKKLDSTFNQTFISGLNKGSASMRDFGMSLVDAADKAGLGTSQIAKMASATGIFSEAQIVAGRASAATAAKADQLARAVAGGEMTTRQAGKAFREFANTQDALVKSTQGSMRSLDGLKASLVEIGKAAAVV